VVYQRMLPYHKARFSAVSEALSKMGKPCIALEVASMDRSYGAIDAHAGMSSDLASARTESICLFPGLDYLDLNAEQVSRATYLGLRSLQPDVVFAPAPAFSEGAGALHYKIRHGGKLFLMDDAWSATDKRGWLTRSVKQLFYGFFDGAFLPAPLHSAYFSGLNIPPERHRFAVDVVGSPDPVEASLRSGVADAAHPFLLFVGRLVPRKGLATILRALSRMGEAGPHLYVIGDGPERLPLETLAKDLGLEDRVSWLGRQDNAIAQAWMGHAQAVVVPSDWETWGLVANEAWSAGAPVLGSDTVGALRATCSEATQWTMLPAGDVAAWQAAITRLLSLPQEQKEQLRNIGFSNAARFSLNAHVKSAMELVAMPPRPRPAALVAGLARLWKGRVAVW